jgi:hypothetical protein
VNHAALLPRLVAVGATALTVGGCAVLGDDPKRTFSLPNNTGDPRLVRRCDDESDCRSPDEGELVQPGESLDFKLYMDEDRTFVVGDAEGVTLGCLVMPLADGTDPPNSLSDLQPCPTGTPKSTER